MTAAKVRRALREKGNPEKAAFFPRFFKSGKGEYAEGDKFLGVVVPEQRKIAKQFIGISDHELKKLVADKYHECRLTALLILVQQFQKADKPRRQEIVDLYLESLDWVNNWDLVDASAEKILGRHLEDKDRSILYEFAREDHLWKQRIAIIATFHFIRQNDFDDTLAIADLLIDHEHDLIHKAVGWMLREVGNRSLTTEEKFLKKRYKKMPRTMLRYAIEKFKEPKRKRYLAGTV